MDGKKADSYMLVANCVKYRKNYYEIVSLILGMFIPNREYLFISVILWKSHNTLVWWKIHVSIVNGKLPYNNMVCSGKYNKIPLVHILSETCWMLMLKLIRGFGLWYGRFLLWRKNVDGVVFDGCHFMKCIVIALSRHWHERFY